MFPVKFLRGRGRSLNFNWLVEYPFLLYSKINDSICCLPCILFCKNSKNKLMKPRWFSNWHKVGNKLKCHVNNDTHLIAMTAATSFKKRLEKLSSTLTCGYGNQRIERVQNNRKIPKWVTKTVDLYGKQCIAFRGQRENIPFSDNNWGYFLAILKLLAETSDNLQNHLTSSVAKNTTYLSPNFQNEILTLLVMIFCKLT